MQVSDKLIKPLTEAKYLNANNVSRYRCIMRIFFEHYEKLKYWLYQEEVYEEMIQDPLFADYRPEQCQQDLTMLTGNPHAFDNGTAAEFPVSDDTDGSIYKVGNPGILCGRP